MDLAPTMCHTGLVSASARDRLSATNPGIDERIADEVADWPSPPPEAVRLWRAIRKQCVAILNSSPTVREDDGNTNRRGVRT